jgi:hypothetical protein
MPHESYPTEVKELLIGGERGEREIYPVLILRYAKAV